MGVSRLAVTVASTSAFAIAGGFAAPAVAQQAAQQAAVPAEAASEEIIVTATLQRESLQKVPLAVSAYNGETLTRSGVVDIRGLQQITPSFFTTTGVGESNGSTLRIRGIGTAGINSGLESSVGVFVDGVYLSRPGVIMGDLLDLEQIEVLRGPQGTLFGRNTSAGLLNIKTRKPSMDGISGFANATYGNYNLFNIQAGVSGPITDTLGVGISGSYRKRDGWLIGPNGTRSADKNRVILRGQIYFEPTSDLTVRVTADYSEYDEKCCTTVFLTNTSYAAAGFYTANGLPADGGLPFVGRDALNNRRTNETIPPQDKADQWGINGTITYNIGGAELTSITGYRDYYSSQQFRNGFSTLDVYSLGNIVNKNVPENYIAIRTFSQELRLAGDAIDGKLDWLVGAYYGNEQLNELTTLTLGKDAQALSSAIFTSLGVPVPNAMRFLFGGGVDANGGYGTNLFQRRARTWSVFTNDTFALSPTLKVNVGVRYGEDRVNTTFSQPAFNNPSCLTTLNNAAPGSPLAGNPLLGLAIAFNCLGVSPAFTGAPGLPAPGTARFSDGRFAYTGKLLWQPSSQLNTYLSYSRGFKSGGQNNNGGGFVLGGPGPNFNSEVNESFEVGAKFRTSDGKFQLNAAAFHMNITDFQSFAFDGINFAIFNVPKVKSSGFELEGTIRPARSLSFVGGVTYANARYPSDCAGAIINPTITDQCGFQLSNAPKWAVTAAIDWRHDVASNLEVGFNANARMVSDQIISDQATQRVLPGTGTLSVSGGNLNAIPFKGGWQDGFTKINLRASIGRPDGSWSLEIWANNVTDVMTANFAVAAPGRGISSLPGPFNAGGIGVATMAFPEEPRTFGATVRTKF